ncbi:MAG: Hsp20/alpha crystallin family protein [Thermodesulfobacteriota bacterium]
MASLMSWNPMGDLMRVGLDFDQFFREFAEPEEAMEGGYCTPPPVESFRHDGRYMIKVDLPGVNPKDGHLTFEGGYLIIEGERKRLHEVEESSMPRDEVCFGAFRRSLYIPEGIKADQIKAKYHDGVLEITAPVDEKFLPQKIEVEDVRA